MLAGWQSPRQLAPWRAPGASILSLRGRSAGGAGETSDQDALHFVERDLVVAAGRETVRRPLARDMEIKPTLESSLFETAFSFSRMYIITLAVFLSGPMTYRGVVGDDLPPVSGHSIPPIKSVTPWPVRSLRPLYDVGSRQRRFIVSRNRRIIEVSYIQCVIPRTSDVTLSPKPPTWITIHPHRRRCRAELGQWLIRCINIPESSGYEACAGRSTN